MAMSPSPALGPASAPAQSGLQQTTEVPITEAHTLLNSFTSFLTVSIHTILFYRNIYPKETFLSAKAFNLPVHQSRHPKVCAWINDAVDAVMLQIAKGAVDRVAVVVHSPLSSTQQSQLSFSSTQQLAPGSVLERWMFDVAHLPSWPGGTEALKNFRGAPGAEKQREDEDSAVTAAAEDDNNGSGEDDNNGGDPSTTSEPVNWADVDEQLRGAVRRLAYTGESMEALPEGCTFTVAVELREEAAAPIGHPQPWIPSQPAGLQHSSQRRQERESDSGGAYTTPIRAVEAGPLFLECWVEESKAKLTFSQNQTSQIN